MWVGGCVGEQQSGVRLACAGAGRCWRRGAGPQPWWVGSRWAVVGGHVALQVDCESPCPCWRGYMPQRWMGIACVTHKCPLERGDAAPCPVGLGWVLAWGSSRDPGAPRPWSRARVLCGQASSPAQGCQAHCRATLRAAWHQDSCKERKGQPHMPGPPACHQGRALCSHHALHLSQ